MSVVDRLRRAEALEQALDELVSLLQADELDIDELDQAVRHADTVLIDSAKRETRDAKTVTAPDSEKACANMPNNIRTDPTPTTGPSQDSQDYESSPPQDTGPDEKACGECGETKPLDDFPANKNTRDGHQGRCFACFRASAAKARAAQAAKRARANGSEPVGARRSPKPADAGSTPARPASAEPSTYENGSSAEDHIEAHVDSMIGAVSGPHRTFTLVDRSGNDVAVEAHPDPDDPAVWAAMLGRVHAAIHDEPVVVTHEPAAASNGRHPVQKHQAGIR